MTSRLSPRELEIVGLLHVGFSGKEIAHHLGIKRSSVSNQVHRAVVKTGCVNSMELVLKFERGEFNE